MEENEAIDDANGLESSKTDIDDSASSTIAPAASEAETKEIPSDKQTKKVPRKLIEEEKRAVGRIGREIWRNYILACGAWGFWTGFGALLLLASLSPVVENGWLRYGQDCVKV